jgi:hypothetical protein
MPKEPLVGPQEIVGGMGLASLGVGLALGCGLPVALIVVGGLLFGLAVWPHLITPLRRN